MYTKHPAFQSPTDENSKIWRYLDFTKFVSLIDRESLFFQRLDKLGDPFEGSITKMNVDIIKEREQAKLAELLKAIGNEVAVKNFFTSMGKLSVVNRKKCAVVNCWHINDYESAAMWKLYLKSDEGIAIQSTFKMLKESFAEYEENDVCIGKVNYIDYKKDIIPNSNLLYPYTFKRKSFQHENELRAVIFKFPKFECGLTSGNASFDKGIYVPVDLQKLIETIYVSPSAEEWFSELVNSIVTKYQLGKKVVKSSLADDPLF